MLISILTLLYVMSCYGFSKFMLDFLKEENFVEGKLSITLQIAVVVVSLAWPFILGVICVHKAVGKAKQ